MRGIATRPAVRQPITATSTGSRSPFAAIVDASRAVVIDLAALDAVLTEEVAQPLDGRHLNEVDPRSSRPANSCRPAKRSRRGAGGGSRRVSLRTPSSNACAWPRMPPSGPTAPGWTDSRWSFEGTMIQHLATGCRCGGRDRRAAAHARRDRSSRRPMMKPGSPWESPPAGSPRPSSGTSPVSRSISAFDRTRLSTTCTASSAPTSRSADMGPIFAGRISDLPVSSRTSGWGPPTAAPSSRMAGDPDLRAACDALKGDQRPAVGDHRCRAV